MTKQLTWKEKYSLKNPMKLLESGASQFFSRFVVIWLAGTAVFLPVKILNLPFNFELVDFWILMGLPVGLVFYGFRRSRVINIAYAIPMWFILIGSLASTFAAPSVSRSLTIILKEMYLFFWFMVVATFLSITTAEDFRKILRIWSGAVVFHGMIIIMQFLSPDLWHFTNSLGGDVVTHEIYRPAGLFICDAAGCANKAAFFQVLGFVPLLMASFSKRTTMLLGLILFASMMGTGSMGATVAFLSGLVVALFMISYLQNRPLMLVKLSVKLAMGLLLLGGVFLIVVSQNEAYLNQFERIAVGRFDKSSGSRFSLWQRGFDVFREYDVFIWGIGPGNFKEVDTGGSNQLHNDMLAFLVERGALGELGLVLFAGMAFARAIYILKIYKQFPTRGRLEIVAFLAILVSTLAESLTHQVFHARELWLVLALQEAVIYKMLNFENGIEDPLTSTVQSSRAFQHGRVLAPKTGVVR